MYVHCFIHVFAYICCHNCKQITTFMNQFTENELKILRNEGMFTVIGRKIPSKRAKTGHISRQHVRNVLTGKDQTESPTNTEIIERAKSFITIYKQLNK
jgi:hypothetical protein